MGTYSILSHCIIFPNSFPMKCSSTDLETVLSCFFERYLPGTVCYSSLFTKHCRICSRFPALPSIEGANAREDKKWWEYCCRRAVQVLTLGGQLCLQNHFATCLPGIGDIVLIYRLVSLYCSHYIQLFHGNDFQCRQIMTHSATYSNFVDFQRHYMKENGKEYQPPLPRKIVYSRAEDPDLNRAQQWWLVWPVPFHSPSSFLFCSLRGTLELYLYHFIQPCVPGAKIWV